VIVRPAPGGGLQVEFSREETRTLRLLAQRASFMDTPPDEQDRILRLAEDLLAALEDRTD